MPMKKVCPRCGATFECLHGDILSCHCAGVSLNAAQRTYLKESYPDCLCHDCLNAVKAGFYAFEINPFYKKKKDDQRSSKHSCQNKNQGNPPKKQGNMPL